MTSMGQGSGVRGQGSGLLRLVLLSAVLVMALLPQPTAAYLKLGANADGRTIDLAWPARTAVRYFVHDAGAADVSASQFRDAIGRAFETWESVDTASVTFEFAGFVGGSPLEDDGINVLGFASRPDLDRTLASTSFLIDTRTGEIVESDIFFNTSFDWSVAPSGEAGRFDVQSIATHEAGHFLGLGHSALGETEVESGGGRRLIASQSVMFPIAFMAGNVVDRELTADDIAGVSDIYPDGSFRRETGTLHGTVRKGGAGVFGAHVVAFNPMTGDLVGGFSLEDDGRFVIAGLEPGSYIVRVEPLDDGDLDSFFDDTAGVDSEFLPAFYPRFVTVPREGASQSIEITVTPK